MSSRVSSAVMRASVTILFAALSCIVTPYSQAQAVSKNAAPSSAMAFSTPQASGGRLDTCGGELRRFHIAGDLRP